MAFGGGLSLLAWIVMAAGAPAPAPAMRVDFNAPAGCSSAEAFRRGVASRLQHGAATDGVPPARIQVRLTRNGDRVVGELRLSHEKGALDTRTVEGAACDEVVDVLALTAALALQPAGHVASRAGGAAAVTSPPSPRETKEAGAVRRASPSRAIAGSAGGGARSSASPAPQSAGEPATLPSTSVSPAGTAVAAPPRRPPAPPPSVASSPPESAPSRPPRIAEPATPAIVAQAASPPRAPGATQLEVGAGAAFARVLSSGPGPNLGGGVMLGLVQQREDRSPRSLRLGWFYLPNDFLLRGGAVVDRWYAFTLTACPGWGLRHGAVDVQACARGIGGWITATDAAVTNPSSASRRWLSAGVLLRGGAALGAGFSLEVEAGVDAPLFHRAFITTTPRQTVAETPPLSLLVGIGVSRRL